MKEIAILKKHILKSENLSSVVDYFFDLMEQERRSSSLLQKMVNDHKNLGLAIEAARVAASQVLKQKVEFRRMHLVEVVGQGFYHGCFEQLAGAVSSL